MILFLLFAWFKNYLIMRPNYTQKLLCNKENHSENRKTTQRMRENICKQCKQQEINL